MSNKSLVLKGLSIVAVIALLLGFGVRGALAQQDHGASVAAVTGAATAAHVAKSEAAKRKQVVGWWCPPFCP